MNSFIIRLKSEEGNLTIIAFVLLVVLTLIGVFATKTAQIDLQTAYNEVPYKQNFYVAEGGVNKEAAELGVGAYPVSNVGQAQTLATLTNVDLPGFSGKTYNATIRYLGPFPAPSGYSAIHFSRYDYNVEARAQGTASSGQVRVASRLYKIGPKAE
jgi:Tfp pilus assembly protein PilX